MNDDSKQCPYCESLLVRMDEDRMLCDECQQRWNPPDPYEIKVLGFGISESNALPSWQPKPKIIVRPEA